MALRNCSTENRIIPRERPRSAISKICFRIGEPFGTSVEAYEIQVASWRKFKRCVSKAINNDIFANTVTSGEVELSQEIANNLRSGEVMVIDIARLDENSQSFVFGSVARAIYDLKLGASRDDIPDKVIIFVDELNKYASTDVPKLFLNCNSPYQPFGNCL